VATLNSRVKLCGWGSYSSVFLANSPAYRHGSPQEVSSRCLFWSVSAGHIFLGLLEELEEMEVSACPPTDS
jgi:hypothetical protein